MPSSEGPSRTPAIISPTTCGWPILRADQPTTRQANKITAICRKNDAASACMGRMTSGFAGSRNVETQSVAIKWMSFMDPFRLARLR